MSRGSFGLALHGGADGRPGRDCGPELAHMHSLVERARELLANGATALDVAVETVFELEAGGFYVAGRGACPNLSGAFELDASVMDGMTGQAGAVAALQGFQSPIRVARAVMERTPHVMLAGAGAGRFADENGLARIEDEAEWFVSGQDGRAEPTAADHGTVGCVVLDEAGRLAAATSTGGTLGKMPGRIGDSPIVAAGVWADARVAVSCTGHGEFFIRSAAAVQIAHRMRFAAQDVATAGDAVLAEIGQAGGRGGLIAIDAEGRIAMPFNAAGMKRAALHPDGSITAAVF